MDLGIVKYRQDIYKCTRCGYCREMVREKDNTFRICPIRENTPGFEAFTGKGKMLLLRGILDGVLEITPRMSEIFFTCSTCGSCKAHCPVGIDTVGIFEVFRKDLQDQELGLPAHVFTCSCNVWKIFRGKKESI